MQVVCKNNFELRICERCDTTQNRSQINLIYGVNHFKINTLKLHQISVALKIMFNVLTSSPDGAIFRYSLTSLELSKTLTLVKSTAVYERTLSGMITEKEIKKFQLRNLYHINIHIFSAYLMVVSSLGAKKKISGQKSKY